MGMELEAGLPSRQSPYADRDGIGEECARRRGRARPGGRWAGGQRLTGSLRRYLAACAAAQKERSPIVLRDHRCGRKGSREVALH